jgi:hypothetical protein
LQLAAIIDTVLDVRFANDYLVPSLRKNFFKRSLFQETLHRPASLIVFLTLLGGVPNQAATIRDDRPDSGYLNLANNSDYQSVGLFVNSWGYTGCGILIAQDWVLTAAHLFVAASSGSFTINGNTYASSQLIAHPNWNGGNVLAGSDFGLVHLGTPVTSLTPATLYMGSDERGKQGTFVGYGLTGTGLTGANHLDNQKRAFQNWIDGDFGLPDLVLGADFDNPLNAADNNFGDAIPLDLEGVVAGGDSGGGVFGTINGQSYLVGVISSVVSIDGNSNSDYGDMTGFGRVSAFSSWIGSYVTTAVPEPSPQALVMLGSLIILARRKVNSSK